MKRTICALSFFVLALLPLSAQQITRFAVVDLPKVYTAFYRDSKDVRDFEEKSTKVQSEFDRMKTELQQLQSQKLDAESAGDRDKVTRLDADIAKKAEFLKEYRRVKTLELEDLRKKLSQSSDFYKQVYDEIRAMAESEGYSMVLNLKESTGIVWYSQSVDITEKLIQNMQAKAAK